MPSIEDLRSIVKRVVQANTACMSRRVDELSISVHDPLLTEVRSTYIREREGINIGSTVAL